MSPSDGGSMPAAADVDRIGKLKFQGTVVSCFFAQTGWPRLTAVARKLFQNQ